MMRDTIPADEILNQATMVGQYYGFTPLTALTQKSRGALKPAESNALAGLALDPVAQTVANFVKQLQRTDSEPNVRRPTFVWHSNIAPGRPAPRKAVVQFHAIGTDRPLSDTLIIRTMLVLVRELFGEEPVVRINSMGDKETRARYTRELSSYFRKHVDTLPGECTECAKRDAVEAAKMAISRSYADDLPVPTEHLSDASRKRFEELLEYLEMTETPYELARDLISMGSAWSEICFEITVRNKRVAWGSRYGDLAKHLLGSPMPAVGAVLHINSAGAASAVSATKRAAHLRFAFVHIGDEAKRLSIELAEHFRKARLPLHQNIGVESLTEQLSIAERHACPYMLVMGRKEALEHCAILRDLRTQQETVLPLATLIDRLRTAA